MLEEFVRWCIWGTARSLGRRRHTLAGERLVLCLAVRAGSARRGWQVAARNMPLAIKVGKLSVRGIATRLNPEI